MKILKALISLLAVFILIAAVLLIFDPNRFYNIFETIQTIILPTNLFHIF